MRKRTFGIFAGVVFALLFAAGFLVVSQTSVPPAAIASAVSRAPAVLERAWTLPAAASYKRQVVWQSNASRCGPASLANAFRSLGDTADTESKVLAGTGWCWTGLCILGLTLDELANAARANSRRKITVLRGLSAEEFKDHLRRSNDPSRRYIVNFSREKIFGAGAGHHSPIGGYLEEDDLVLVLDVNAQFQPWLVERGRLFSAVDTLDGAQKRGLLLIE